MAVRRGGSGVTMEVDPATGNHPEGCTQTEPFTIDTAPSIVRGPLQVDER
jgi:hypothetical protein